MLKRSLRLLVFSVLGIAVLLGGAVVSLEQHLNSGGFKQDLAQTLSRELGRPVHIEGRLKIRLFPSIGLHVSSLSIPQLEGFGTEPLLSVQSVGFNLALAPLLSGRLEFGTVRLDSIRLRLVRNEQGTGNWEGLSSGVPARSPDRDFSIRRVIMRDAAVIFNDLLGNDEYYFDQLELRTQRLGSGDQTPFTLKGDFGGMGVNGEARLKGLVGLPEKGGQPSVSELTVALTLDGPFLPPGAQPVRLESPVQLKPHVALTDVRGDYLKMPFSGSLRLNWDKDWTVVGELGTGRIDLLPVLIRHFEDSFGHSKGNTLRQVQLRSKVFMDASGLRLQKLTVDVDGARARGEVQMPFVLPIRLKADLKADVVDINPYIDDFDTELPAWVGDVQPEFFEWLPLEADLSSQVFRWGGFEAADVSLHLSAAEGDLRVTNVRAEVARGSLTGTASARVRGGDRPDIAFEMNASVTGADMPGLGAMFEVADVPAGTGDLTCQVRRGQGALDDEDELVLLMHTASGSMKLDMDSARARGVSLGRLEAELRFSSGKTGWWAVSEGIFSSPDSRRTSRFDIEGLAPFDDPLVVGSAKGEYGIYPVPQAPPSLRFLGEGTLNLRKMTFDAPTAEAELWGLHLTGSATGQSLRSDSWQISGRAEVRDSSPRRILASQGLDMSFLVDAEAWSSLSGTASYTVNTRGVFFSDMKGTLDDTSFDGELDIHGWEKSEVGCNLNLSGIMLDRYLPERREEDTKAAPKPLPLKTLSDMRLSAALEARDVIWRGLDLSRFRTEFIARDGVLEMPVLEVALQQGSLSASARGRVEENGLALNFDGSLNSIDLGPVVRALYGKEYLRGLGGAEFSMESFGSTYQDVRQLLTGKVSCRAVDGSFLRMGQEREKEEDTDKSNNLQELDRNDSGRDAYTDFNKVSAVFEASRGVFTTDDFNMDAKTFNAKGEGRFSLPEDTIEAKLVVDMAALPDVPLRVHGQLSSPEFSVPKGELVGNTFNSIFGIPKTGWNLLKNIGDFIF